MFYEEKLTTVRLWKNRAERRQENMKHILPILTAALALTATSAFAAFNYDVEWTQYDNSHLEGTSGRYFTINVTEGKGKIYITDIFNNIQSPTQNEAIAHPNMGVTRYGYYYVGNPNDTSLHDFAVSDSDRVSQLDSPLDSYKLTEWDNAGHSWEVTYYRNEYLLGEFKAGDVIEVYMTDGNVAVSSNTPVNEGQNRHISNYDVRQDKLNPAMKIGTLYLGPTHGTQVNFGIVGFASEGSGTDEGGGTVGSPLPGGLQIALIAGLFGLGFWYVRRRKTIAA